jgi:hypothetical protein
MDAKPKYERKSFRFSPNDIEKAISFSKSRAIIGRMAASGATKKRSG